MYIFVKKFINNGDMKFAIDTSSKKKHYVEKDNYYIAEDDKLLTIKISLNGDSNKTQDIFDLFCYFMDLNPGDRRAYRTLLDNNRIFVSRTDLCNKCKATFSGNVRAYYANFRHLSILGIMTKDKDGFYCVTDKFNLNNYKNVEVIAFKLNN